jgi:isovaleryl-CoA dehydrogenase
MTEATVTSISALLDSVRAIANDVIAPEGAKVDRERRYPGEGLRALAEVGALGLLCGSDHGGADGDLQSLALACEEVGAACASTGMVYLMHLVATAAVRSGGGSAAVELLPALAAGDLTATLAFSERGAGAHFYAPELQAERSGGRVFVSGRKSFVTSGGHADLLLVLLQSETEGLDCYAVRGADPGVRADGMWTGLGMRGNSSVAVDFDRVAVDPDAARIGAPGTGGDLVFGAVAPTFLVGLAAVNVGIARAALTAAVQHAGKRSYASGQLLSEVPAIQVMLARMDLQTSSARCLLHRAAQLGDAGDAGALVSVMEAKISCTETSASVAQGALEVCGGQGYTEALSIERHIRDSLAGAVMALTNGVLRTWTAKALSGLPVP